MNRKLLLSAQVQAAPEKASQVILEAYKAAQTSQRDAAKALGVSEPTFMRWVKQLGLGPKMRAMAEAAREEGWHHGRNSLGGRPKAPASQKLKKSG